MEVPLNKITYSDGTHIHGIHAMEDGVTKYPRESTVICISEALGIKPDILLYSFGHLPDKEKDIISSDPFFYREKILELCNNHNNRYTQRVDLDLLNLKRAADYIEHNRCERKIRAKRSKENDSAK